MAVGLTSVGAVRLSARLRALTNLTLPPTLVFEWPTARTIADHLASLGELPDADALLRLVREELRVSHGDSSHAHRASSQTSAVGNEPLDKLLPAPSFREPDDITTLTLQRPLPSSEPPAQDYTDRVHSPYLVDTLENPMEYWYAVSTDLPAAQWWFHAHCSLRASVVRVPSGQWRWNGQRAELPQFETLRGWRDVSHLVYYCTGEARLVLHHLVFDGFALRFLSGQTQSRHAAEADLAFRNDYLRYRSQGMLDSVRTVVATPLFSKEAVEANRACTVFKQQCLDAPPCLGHLVVRMSREAGVSLADAFYAITIVLTLEAAGLTTGPVLLNDNCRDATNSNIFGMVQREYGCLFEHRPDESFERNVHRTASTINALPQVYRRMFSEYALGEYPELFINNYDGILLNFLGLEAGSEPEGPAPPHVGDHLQWTWLYEEHMANEGLQAGEGPGMDDFSSNLYCVFHGTEFGVCGRATSVSWFCAAVWPRLLHHAHEAGGALGGGEGQGGAAGTSCIQKPP